MAPGDAFRAPPADQTTGRVLFSLGALLCLALLTVAGFALKIYEAHQPLPPPPTYTAEEIEFHPRSPQLRWARLKGERDWHCAILDTDTGRWSLFDGVVRPGNLTGEEKTHETQPLVR